MGLLETVKFKPVNPKNCSTGYRPVSNIKYVIIHYTGNVGDTANNNAEYFASTVVGASAHYFVDENEIWQSVPDNMAAWAVGLGNRKEPYFRWPTMYQRVTNNNSISIEICGGYKSLEANTITKLRAAELCAELLHKYNLTPANVYRHYDVTGKECPRWAVQYPEKWEDFKSWVNNYYKEGDDNMLNTDENYNVFKEFMDRYKSELDKAQPTSAWESDAMQSALESGIMDGTRPKSLVTRAELAVVAKRLGKK